MLCKVNKLLYSGQWGWPTRTRNVNLSAGTYQFWFRLNSSSTRPVEITVKQNGTTLYENKNSSAAQAIKDYSEYKDITVPANWEVSIYLGRNDSTLYYKVNSWTDKHKIFIWGVYEIWTKKNVISYGRLPNWEWRDGN